MSSRSVMAHRRLLPGITSPPSVSKKVEAQPTQCHTAAPHARNRRLHADGVAQLVPELERARQPVGADEACKWVVRIAAYLVKPILVWPEGPPGREVLAAPRPSPRRALFLLLVEELPKHLDEGRGEVLAYIAAAADAEAQTVFGHEKCRCCRPGPGRSPRGPAPWRCAARSSTFLPARGKTAKRNPSSRSRNRTPS
jgi:hypothetical protein